MIVRGIKESRVKAIISFIRMLKNGKSLFKLTFISPHFFEGKLVKRMLLPKGSFFEFKHYSIMSLNWHRELFHKTSCINEGNKYLMKRFEKLNPTNMVNKFSVSITSLPFLSEVISKSNIPPFPKPFIIS
jgi:hypothetical protein